MMQPSLKIGKYEIGIRTLPNVPKPVCLSIYIVEGKDEGEGGTFDINKFEKAVDAFYKEHF